MAGARAKGGDPPAALVAVDGGNSKTDVALVAGDGAVLGRARGAGSNHQLLGVDGAMEAVDAAVAAAAREAGLDPDARPVAGTGAFCLAGLDLDTDDRALGPAIAARGWSSADLLFNDTMAVSRAGMTGTWGVGVVCGTGLNCAGIGPDGATVRFPSLGELSGDFTPGGAWLGVRALGLALRSLDGRGPPTALAELVPSHFGLGSPTDVLTAVYGGELPYHRLFELAEVLLDAAAGGDRPAGEAAGQLAAEVVAMAGAAVTRLGVGHLPVEVVLGGGVFATRHADFIAAVENGIRAVAPDARLRHLDAPPLLGAVLLGLDALGAGDDAARRVRRHLRT